MLNLDYNGTRLLVHSGSKVQGSNISFTKANKKDFLSSSKCSTCLESSNEALDALKALSKLMRLNRCLLIVLGAPIYRVLGLGAQETKKQSEVLQNQIYFTVVQGQIVRYALCRQLLSHFILSIPLTSRVQTFCQSLYIVQKISMRISTWPMVLPV